MHDPVTIPCFEDEQHRSYVRETLDAMAAPSVRDAAELANQPAG